MKEGDKMTDLATKRVWGPTPLYPKVLATQAKHGGEFIVVAGPCSIESREQMESIIPVLKQCNVTYARGGVFRAGTYPGKEFGLTPQLAKEWSFLCRKAGLKVVIEVLDVREIEWFAERCDAFQVGARHMQDYVLLRELSQFNRPVFLKRHPGSTLDELLGAAEHLLSGSCKPVLVERGSSTHMNHVRWDLSISLIAAVKKLTGIPIIVDASHGTGRRDLVESMTLAGVAAGADGFIVEIHPKPDQSISDADQALPLERLDSLVARAELIHLDITCAMSKVSKGPWVTS